MPQAYDCFVTTWLCPLPIQQQQPARNGEEDDVRVAFLSEQTDGAVRGERDEKADSEAVGACNRLVLRWAIGKLS